MTVKIVTDSLADIPAAVTRDLGIAVIPVNVLFGTESFRDGIDLTTDQFYAKLQQTKLFPTTAVPPIGTFIEVYDRLAEKTNEFIVITLSSKLSATHEAALQAVKQMKHECRVEVIDSTWVAMAEGLVVIATAKAVKAGAKFEDAVALTRKNIGRVDVRMAFDTLEYLKRGGRIGRARAFLGSVLRVNPVLTLKNGEVFPVCRERSRTRALDHLYNFASSYKHIEEMSVEDATTPDEADKLVERLSSKFPGERIYRSKVSPVLGAHVGPHVVSVSVLGDK